MNAESPVFLGTTRARISPRGCPTCDGTGRVPSRQVVGVSLACPTCSSARDDFAVFRPDHRLEAVEPGGCAPPVQTSPAAVDRRRDLDADDRSRWTAALLFMAGSACGAVFGLLVVGVFRVLT